jgi:dimethylsulfone monooxygenase
MVRSSTAPDLSTDGLTSLERAKRNELILGLFLPTFNGAWSPSTAPRSTHWSFEYNAECSVRAEELGFDLLFGAMHWLGKGGFGGEMNFRENALDPLMTAAALSSLTKNVMLVSTVHLLYKWHPVNLAKFAATLDHISKGRWGLNVVTGFRPSEARMFGIDQIDHDLRYKMAAEFTDLMLKMWAATEEVDYRGDFYKTERGWITPKPVNGRPVIINAGSSGAGLEYAAKYSDLIFITSPAGHDPSKACESLSAYTAKIKDLGRKFGNEVRTIINPNVICRETEKEARDQVRAIIEHQDSIAAQNYYASFMTGDQSSWKKTNLDGWIIGGNVHLVGTPEQIVDWFAKLKKAGCDGVQVNFYDYKPELEYFGARVLPLMKQAGLRR